MDRSTWQINPFSWTLAESLAAGLDAPLLVGMALAGRGFGSVEEARAFLSDTDVVPDPFLLGGMEAAVTLLDEAVTRHRRVVVHGDYDVDGVSATALMVRVLAGLGLPVQAYLPSRFTHGYGLSRQAVEEIAPAGGLLITVDCGVNYPEEVDLALGLGLDVIVTDHHQLGPVLPDCPVVHPSVGAYPDADLCGVGVALKLLHGLLVVRQQAARDRLPEALSRHLDLVALGTIADLVPLRGENRQYVREGLVRLNATEKPGIVALARLARCEGEVDAGRVGFRLAPRLNAAGRLSDPQAPLRLLLTDDQSEAERLAQELDDLNRQRQEVEGRILAEALERAEALDPLPSALVLAGEGWHEGVIGIVASRLVERYHRPTVLLSVTEGVAKGSGRSIPPYDLMSGLWACDDLLTVFGGHRQAAGMTLPGDRVDEFAACLTAHAAAHLTADDLVPVYRADAVIRGQDLTLETVDALATMAPFGMGNPNVRLLALGAELKDPCRTRTGEHLRCTMALDGVRAKGIGFGLGAAMIPLEEEGFRCHAGLSLEADEWQGRARTQVHLHSVYRTGAIEEETLGCAPGCPFLDPLEGAAVCDRCGDPDGDVRAAVALPGRDHRGLRGRLTAIARVLSSGEPAAAVGSSVADVLREATGGLPLMNLGVREVDCVSRHCWRTRGAGRLEALLILDWRAAQRRRSFLAEKTHLLVVDPPFTAGQTVLLREMAERGLQIHLLYGPEERARTVRQLRPMLHPRFWMVPLFRVWRDGFTGPEAWQEARRRVWDAHGVLPEAADLQAAEDLLGLLGFHLREGKGAAEASPTSEEATMDVARLPAYAAAEQAYEQAVRLCQTI